MATVIGVRFKKAGKVYYFDPNDFWPKPGDSVVVETMRGLELGEVVTSARTVADGHCMLSAPQSEWLVRGTGMPDDGRQDRGNGKRRVSAG